MGNTLTTHAIEVRREEILLDLKSVVPADELNERLEQTLYRELRSIVERELNNCNYNGHTVQNIHEARLLRAMDQLASYLHSKHAMLVLPASIDEETDDEV